MGWREERTFGPTVEHKDGSDALRAHCTWCAFRVGDTCTHQRPSRKIPDPENTPEWCIMLPGMLKEVREVLAIQKVNAHANKFARPLCRPTDTLQLQCSEQANACEQDEGA